ncbi:MAG: hypothetical protein HUJ31_15530 [Pseudomonadales bacterium]|nr:hypothetical protein [Pseudomonadales bacterium]
MVTWISSARPAGGNLRIARTESDGEHSEITYLTEASSCNDYKPCISPDGSKILFFRTYQEDPSFFKWRSAICVMNIDGSDLHEVTAHDYMNTEPYWMRDGSDRVVFNRMIENDDGPVGTFVYWSAWDGEPGDEENLSATNWEWHNSSLRDGRIWVKQSNGYYLMTPEPGGQSTYEELAYPDSYHYLHKGSISNDETMVAYMKKVDPKGDDYLGSELIYAEFDAAAPAIRNEVVFSPHDETKFSWYVTIAPDNKTILFAENGKIMQHDIEAGENRQLSTPEDVEYRYPTYLGTVK